MTNKAGEQPTITLLPCPFCGGEAQCFTLTEEDEPMNAGGDVITCLRCQASSHVEFGRKENLVECWNTRTTSLAAQDGLVEALKSVMHCFDLEKAHEVASDALSAIKGDK